MFELLLFLLWFSFAISLLLQKLFHNVLPLRNFRVLYALFSSFVVQFSKCNFCCHPLALYLPRCDSPTSISHSSSLVKYFLESFLVFYPFFLQVPVCFLRQLDYYITDVWICQVLFKNFSKNLIVC